MDRHRRLNLISFKYTCQSCEHSHRTPSVLRSFDLDLPRSGQTTSLQACIDDYEKEVVLTDYRCEGCEAVANVTKTTKLQKAPRTLIVKLTRTDHMGKIMTKVAFPRLATVDTWDGKVNYKVHGLVEHTGTR